MAAFGVAAIIRHSFHEMKSLKAKKASLTGPELHGLPGIPFLKEFE
jgi:hypothetical protein